MSPSLALILVTVADRGLPRRVTYISQAAVGTSALVADTTYTFSYAIVMKAGMRAWAGSGSVALTVRPDGSLAEVTSTDGGSRRP